jgi:hypothetical protein
MVLMLIYDMVVSPCGREFLFLFQENLLLLREDRS